MVLNRLCPLTEFLHVPPRGARPGASPPADPMIGPCCRQSMPTRRAEHDAPCCPRSAATVASKSMVPAAVGACSRVDVGVTCVGSDVNRIGAVCNVFHLQLNKRKTEGDIYRRWRAVGASGTRQRQIRRAKDCTMKIPFSLKIAAPHSSCPQGNGLLRSCAACRLNSPKHLHVDVQRVTLGGWPREGQRRLAV